MFYGDNMVHFLVYSGSSRKGNHTAHVAQFVQRVADAHQDVSAELITPGQLNLSFADEGQSAVSPEFSRKVAAADGYILVSPEYNHGYSATLKYMLDLNLQEYIHKPAAIVGVSKGPWGGTRMIEQLIQVNRELGLVSTFTDLQVTQVREEFTEQGPTDPEKWTKRAERMLEELVWMAKTLQYGRENIPSQYHQKKAE